MSMRVPVRMIDRRVGIVILMLRCVGIFRLEVEWFDGNIRRALNRVNNFSGEGNTECRDVRLKY